MKDYHYAAIASIGLHALLIALVAALSPVESREVRTIEVDFALVQGPGMDQAGPGAAAQETGRPARARTGGGSALKVPGRASKRPGPQHQPDLNHAATGTDPVIHIDAGPAADHATADAYANAGGDGEGLHYGGTGGTGTGRGGGFGPGAGGSPGGGTGAGGSGGNGDGIAAGGRDYRYIRDAVMQNVRYPEEAIRLGIEGSVLVSFKVLENGRPSEVKVVKGSGSRLLDRSATEAVARTRIGRKVPYRVLVHLPITYRLRG